MLETIERYKKELDIDTKIDELNLRDQQMKLPAIKHKYAAYFIHHKYNLQKLEKVKKQAIESIVENNTPVYGVSRPAAEKMASNHATIKELNEKIEAERLIIEYLEKVEAIMKNFTYDIKNVIDIMKMETT